MEWLTNMNLGTGWVFAFSIGLASTLLYLVSRYFYFELMSILEEAEFDLTLDFLNDDKKSIHLCIGKFQGKDVFIDKRHQMMTYFIPFFCFVYVFDPDTIKNSFVASYLSKKTKGRRLFILDKGKNGVGIYIEKEPG